MIDENDWVTATTLTDFLTPFYQWVRRTSDFQWEKWKLELFSRTTWHARKIRRVLAESSVNLHDLRSSVQTWFWRLKEQQERSQIGFFKIYKAYKAKFREYLPQESQVGNEPMKQKSLLMAERMLVGIKTKVSGSKKKNTTYILMSQE